jgi:arabinan endo-1,5-alpha-L-arabinosidase
VVELSDDGCSVKEGFTPVKVAGDMMEGVYVHKRGRYYYLFASEGSCCVKEKSTYHVVVGRSESPLGPFTSKSGMPMTAGPEGVYDGTILCRDADSLFCGPGHGSRIVKDGRGRDWMAYHAFWKGNSYNGRCMNLDRVFWTKDGWPFFKEGVPSSSAPSPVFSKRKASRK